MEFTIRPIAPRDAEGFNALRRMPGVFENILGIPSERVQWNLEGIEDLSSNDHNFVAVVPAADGGELVIGTIGLAVAQSPRRRHVGTIGLMVHREYQDQGVGTALMEAALDVADNWLMLVRVDLEVFSDNERAIHLYEKFGFQREGLLRASAIRNGAYVDEIVMARLRHCGDAP